MHCNCETSGGWRARKIGLVASFGTLCLSIKACTNRAANVHQPGWCVPVQAFHLLVRCTEQRHEQGIRGGGFPRSPANRTLPSAMTPEAKGAAPSCALRTCGWRIDTEAMKRLDSRNALP